MLEWFRWKSKIKKRFCAITKKGKKMFGTLKTVEEQNLYASFGIVDGLSDDELMDINGGDCFVNVSIPIGCIVNGKGDGKQSPDLGSGGSSGSNSSSSSSAS